MRKTGILILMLMALCACQGALRITVDRANVEVGPGREAVPVQVSVTGDWTASASADWIHPGASHGAAGDFTLTITVDANEEETPREGSVTLMALDISQLITIRQAALQLPPRQYVRIRHHRDMLEAPAFGGDPARAVIDWGDGQTETWASGLVHRYGAAGDYEVVVEVRGAETISQTGIDGLAVVDLSEF
ncbi:MAG: BACON domain-containing protein [Bacteroidales bacterium]|nr:BACON domain-containing protein [Bacteroidales bacterium]